MPVHEASMSFGRSRSFHSSDAKLCSMSIAPWVSMGASANALLAAQSISCKASVTTQGKPPPP